MGTPTADTDPAPARGVHPNDRPLTRICALADWDDPALAATIADVTGADGPPARHRKLWEFALGIQALERGGVLHEDAIGLSVGAGHEAIVYHLTNRCRWVFATDIYGSGGFTHVEGSSLMLVDPDLYAPYPYRRNRLTVSYMDALDLRFEDETFDFVVSFGSIEHFGGIGAAGRSLAEAARVLKPGGVAAVTTEFAIDGGPHASLPDLELFTAETIPHLLALAPSLSPIDGMDLAVPDNSAAPVIELGAELGRIQAGDQTYPHVRMRVADGANRRLFTSISLALRKGDVT